MPWQWAQRLLHGDSEFVQNQSSSMRSRTHTPPEPGPGLLLLAAPHAHRVAASFVSQLLVTNEEGRTNFNVPPFLLTYLSTSVFTVFLPLVQLKSLLQETWLLRCALQLSAARPVLPAASREQHLYTPYLNTACCSPPLQAVLCCAVLACHAGAASSTNPCRTMRSQHTSQQQQQRQMQMQQHLQALQTAAAAAPAVQQLVLVG